MDTFADLPRYHGKCLKIARGKVKEGDSFTCPICDHRVRIPRDAARPKLEDLQNWQDEIPTLPFQPEEEDILDRIVDKAGTFRDFLQQYTNNNICRTSEEMPTILFYLRKLEGAEVLLSYETNLFRQEVYKWQPIAPEPPPIIETSLSTRKPRPTKQQKLMAQMGITNPEDLPINLRSKHSTKRKNTDPQVRPPPPLQPAQQARSDTPAGPIRQSSTGNPPNSATNGFDSPYSYGGHHRSGSPPLFSPASSIAPLRDPLMGSAVATSDGLSGMFSPGFRIGGDDDIRTGLAGSSNDVNGGGSSPQPPPQDGADDLFAEMTGHRDADDEDITMRDREENAVDHESSLAATAGLAVSSLEHEASQASEALDALNNSAEDEKAGKDGNADGEAGEEGGVSIEEFLV